MMWEGWEEDVFVRRVPGEQADGVGRGEGARQLGAFPGSSEGGHSGLFVAELLASGAALHRLSRVFSGCREVFLGPPYSVNLVLCFVSLAFKGSHPQVHAPVPPSLFGVKVCPAGGTRVLGLRYGL